VNLDPPVIALFGSVIATCLDDFGVTNVPVERLSVTSASISGTSGSPLRPGFYAAALLTTLLLSDSPLLENEHRVLLESNHAVVQGLQSRHHFQVMDGP